MGCCCLGWRNSVHSRHKPLFPTWNSPPGMLPLQPQRSLLAGVCLGQAALQKAHKTPWQDLRISQAGCGGCRRAPCLLLPCVFFLVVATASRHLRGHTWQMQLVGLTCYPLASCERHIRSRRKRGAPCLEEPMRSSTAVAWPGGPFVRWLCALVL